MFLKLLGDLLFQITTGSETFDPLAATKKAAVKGCLEMTGETRLLLL